MARVLLLCMALVVLSSMLHVSLGNTTHVVGDRLGWTVPPAGEIAYRTWAANQDFTVGDLLVFNFTTGTQDVNRVTRDEYNSCNTTSPILTTTHGPTTIALSLPGQFYFICNFHRHCKLGQRLAINVTPSPALPPETAPSPANTPVASPAPSSPTPTPSGSTPPPSKNSASSFGDKILPFTFLAVALAFLFN